MHLEKLQIDLSASDFDYLSDHKILNISTKPKLAALCFSDITLNFLHLPYKIARWSCDNCLPPYKILRRHKFNNTVERIWFVFG